MTYKLIVQNARLILKTAAGVTLNFIGIKDSNTGTGAVANNLIDWKLLNYCDTSANLTSANPVLGLGQHAFTSDVFYGATDQMQFKVGDGVQTWSNLDYMPVGSGGGGGSQTLAQTLVLGNTTGANDIVLSGTKALTTDNNVVSKLALNGAIAGDVDLTVYNDLIINCGNDLDITAGNTNISDNLKMLNETASTLTYLDSFKRLRSLDTTTNPNLTEITYVKGVTSPIQTQLDAKVDENIAIVGATKTKITYDAKGLVTSGTDATTADINDSSNRRYITDAQLVVVGNTSGTNSGNETTSTLGVTINGAVAATPNDTDLVATVDTSVVKKITWTNVKAFLKTYFDTLYPSGSGSSTGTNTGDNAVNTLYSGLVSNATHTGEVTGATALTLDKTAITNKTLVTADASDHVLIADASDTGNLKKVLVSDFGGAGTTNLGYTASSTNGTVTSDTGTDATIPLADVTNAGLLKPAKFTVLENTSGTNSGDNAVNSNYSSLVTNATHTGDATGATALTVVALNGTNLAGLTTGVLKNTTTTGVPFISKVVLTEPATLATLTIVNNKTLTVNNSITLSGTDATTHTFPTTTSTLARTDAAQTFTGVQTMTSPVINTSLELGHATDTTLTRSSAGVLAVEGVVIPSVSSTNTLTNKRITSRVYSAANNASLTPEKNTYDIFHLTAMSAATTINNHSTTTPADGDKIQIRFLDNGTARALTWGTAYVAKGGIALPSTTVISKNLMLGFEYNANLAKWNLIASAQEA